MTTIPWGAKVRFTERALSTFNANEGVDDQEHLVVATEQYDDVRLENGDLWNSMWLEWIAPTVQVPAQEDDK